MASDRITKVRTRCPACRSKYTVPASFVGHHARCTQCEKRFIVQEYNSHPTEEDILRWLNEGDNGEPTYSPRIVTGTSQPAPIVEAKAKASRTASPSHPTNRWADPTPADA